MYMYSDTAPSPSDRNTMSHDVIHHHPQLLPQQPISPPLPSPLLHAAEEQVSIDEISSPISARILELCDSELFPDTTSSNCCYEDNHTSSYTTLDVENKLNNRNTNPFESSEEIINENDISASIDFSSSSQAFSLPSSLQFDFSLVHHHHHPQVPSDNSLVNVNVVNGMSHHYHHHHQHHHVPLNHSLPSLFEEDCLGGSYVSNCTYLGQGIGAYMPPPPPPSSNAFSGGSSGIYGRSILMGGSELQPQELEFQGENGGIYCPDSIHRVFNPPDLQALSAESQQLVSGPGSSTTMTPEISNLEDSSFKVGKLSVEQRKEKIDRYMKKRNERNFNKKIKYACRKTLADSRPRVRGRFAKNDEFGENHRPASSNHEEEDEEEVVVKEEDDMVDSSDIFAYISGVNSFKCNQSIQSWI